jgi:hypothetical protein
MGLKIFFVRDFSSAAPSTGEDVQLLGNAGGGLHSIVLGRLSWDGG